MDKEDHMKLLITLIIVLLMFFSTTYASSKLNGDIVQDTSQLSSSRTDSRIVQPTLQEKQVVHQQSDTAFLETLFSSLDTQQKEQVQQTLRTYKNSPVEALKVKAQSLEGSSL